MTDIPDIRRRCDGSIDTEFYLQKGHHHRSKAVHELLRDSRTMMRRVPVWLVAFPAFLAFWSSQR